MGKLQFVQRTPPVHRYLGHIPREAATYGLILNAEAQNLLEDRSAVEQRASDLPCLGSFAAQHPFGVSEQTFGVPAILLL